MYRTFGKRMLDLTLAVPALILLAPVLLILALVVRWRLGRPVVFRQQRPGQGGKPFVLYKFRTMLETRDAQGNCLPDEQRLTPLGLWLRSTSLDELPEFYNVIRGDMSLVGPRPLLMKYLGRYDPTQARRHEVRPGLTGWAQVSGRNALSWDEKFVLDIRYVQQCGLWLDLKILARTVLILFTRQGISPPGRVISEEFLGSRADSPCRAGSQSRAALRPAAKPKGIAG
jgi:lipopolysaccharide/colanic/teichoic acid biosynthesis glycosyltransferase